MPGFDATECTFCAIATGKLPAAMVYEDSLVVAFLDRGPIRRGHTQIVPRLHYPYFDDAPPQIAAHIVGLGQRLARAMKSLYAVPRVAFVFTGGDIAHVHAHVVPLHEATDITSRRYIIEAPLTFRSLPQAPHAELVDTAHQLRTALIIPDKG